MSFDDGRRILCTKTTIIFIDPLWRKFVVSLQQWTHKTATVSMLCANSSNNNISNKNTIKKAKTKTYVQLKVLRLRVCSCLHGNISVPIVCISKAPLKFTRKFLPSYDVKKCFFFIQTLSNNLFAFVICVARARRTLTPSNHLPSPEPTNGF